jgi:5'-3' exonuclease
VAGALKASIGGQNPAASFVVATTILGNDFIPRHKVLEDFVTTMRTIVNILGQINEDLAQIDNGEYSIKWKPYLKFLAIMSQHESELAVAAYLRNRAPIIGGSIKAYAFDYDNFAGKYRAMVMEKDGHGRSFDALTVEMVTNYLNMVPYVLSYYGNGTKTINLDMYYQFYYPPLLKDLASVAIKQVVPVAKNKEWLSHGEQFLDPMRLMVATLPPRSFRLMPSVLAATIEAKIKSNSQWASLFPVNITNDKEGYSVDHVGPVFVPIIPPRVIKDLRIPQASNTA